MIDHVSLIIESNINLMSFLFVFLNLCFFFGYFSLVPSDLVVFVEILLLEFLFVLYDFFLRVFNVID
ncbi:hypothetical protein O9993_08070 [Vibrio lentus]|nr:hypothetical protein [Vibrio lentus]